LKLLLGNLQTHLLLTRTAQYPHQKIAPEYFGCFAFVLSPRCGHWAIWPLRQTVWINPQRLILNLPVPDFASRKD